MSLIRGTLSFDHPLRVRSDAGTGKRNDPEYNRVRKLNWRRLNREKVRAYNREYMRKWRLLNGRHG